MRSGIYDRATLASIAIGGVAGAATRWILTRPNSSSGGWFAYAPNTSVTFETGIDGFAPVSGTQLPVETLIVNLLGCAILGGLITLLNRHRRTAAPTADSATSSATAQRNRTMLVGASTGFCGSLTTFSTFAVEVAALLQGRLLVAGQVGDLTAAGSVEPAYLTAILYLVLSVLGGAMSFCFGRALTRSRTT